ncbi:FAD/NAD(P)-binding domain-containing protein [Polyplosphaeria fusca]|uniref:FAD/NAD(P)-binding domain-containing protein n=1 Tax=Polyplosphaeria fusca TaxID=682080 RepID=A0A9P4R321_9PLEO|nr:FAD/NAD(P)-binding domain-containing protein [Polyplosphaeria fusca]
MAGKSSHEYDAIIVGAGFAGVYQLYKLCQTGLSVILFEAGEDVGGTWYWNCYPGATSDVQSVVYRYSWDKEDLVSYPWKNNYLTQPEIQAYFNHIVNKHDLRKHIRCGVKVVESRFDETSYKWQVKLESGQTFHSRYLIAAVGGLHKAFIPHIPGVEEFKGETYHTSNWPRRHDFREKRVGIIGSGSTGAQLFVALSKESKHVTTFIRSTQLIVTNGNRPVTEAERAHINDTYDEIWERLRNSKKAFGFVEPDTLAMSVSEHERRRLFQEAWDRGNAFYYTFGIFSDITSNVEANQAASDFLKEKVNAIVKNPDTVRKLLPAGPYARRPISCDGYYETFNRENVSLVSLKETPFKQWTSTGVTTADGVHHDLDVLVFATGFDFATGSFEDLSIIGSLGRTLNDHWADVPSSYLGFAMAGFSNFFALNGPLHAFTNAVPQIEEQVDLVTDLILNAEASESTVEATPAAEQWWTELCHDFVKGNSFDRVGGWLFGDNIPGKKRNILMFLGGFKKYREHLAGVREQGFEGFDFKTRVTK